jgi:hypothetical protein
VSKLEGEFKRWSGLVTELSTELSVLPMKVIIAAGFITYLAYASEQVGLPLLFSFVLSSISLR